MAFLYRPVRRPSVDFWQDWHSYASFLIVQGAPRRPGGCGFQAEDQVKDLQSTVRCRRKRQGDGRCHSTHVLLNRIFQGIVSGFFYLRNPSVKITQPDHINGSLSSTCFMEESLAGFVVPYNNRICFYLKNQKISKLPEKDDSPEVWFGCMFSCCTIFWLCFSSISFMARTFSGSPNRLMNPSASW